MAEPRGAAGVRRRLSEVIGAAAKVFAQRGYHGASTQDIADVLGIRQASLYYYFESKEAALEAVCRYGHEAYVERLRDRPQRSDRSEKVAQVLLQHQAAPERLDFTLVFLRERASCRGRRASASARSSSATSAPSSASSSRAFVRASSAGSRRAHDDPRAAWPRQHRRALVRARTRHAAERMLGAYIDLLVRALRRRGTVTVVK